MTSPVVIIIPGVLPITNLTAMGPTQLVADVPCLAPLAASSGSGTCDPTTGLMLSGGTNGVHSICVSLIPAHCAGLLTANDGIGVYVTDFRSGSEGDLPPQQGGSFQQAGGCATAGGENYHFLGFVSIEKPSIQPKLPQALALNVPARFGLSFEAVSVLKNLASSPVSRNAPSALLTLNNGFGVDYSSAGGFATSPSRRNAAAPPPSAVRIGRTIVSHLHTFLASFAKMYVCEQTGQGEEVAYLPSDWEQRWFAKFIAKRDAGAYSGEEEEN